MKLYALSDLHVGKRENLLAIARMRARPDDWLIVAGDVGETVRHLEVTLELLAPKFARLIWVPGNHELWTAGRRDAGLRGEAKYMALVEACRRRDVLTPEDPYPTWTGEGTACVLAPLFLLYDYSFRPDSVPRDRALAWAAETGIVCADEELLHPDPYPSREAWCEARCRESERRLAAISPEMPTVLINHFPLRRDLAILPRIPRFSIWCGTTRTEDWHVRFRAHAVVSGHLHIRSTQWRDGVRFEEVSLGYPRQWNQDRSVDDYVRQVLPAPQVPPT